MTTPHLAQRIQTAHQRIQQSITERDHYIRQAWQEGWTLQAIADLIDGTRQNIHRITRER